MTDCPETVLRLVERYSAQLDQVSSPDYNEAQLRIDFINPLFLELGWDISNAQGFAEQYREVVHEDRVRVGGQNKAPDYSFRVGGQRKFFLEAKKPAVDLKSNWEPAYQLRRYGWSAKMPCSLLTNFGGLAIYDTRIQPKIFDKASIARREYIAFTDYAERWQFIHGTFSKDAVLRGNYDRYCSAKKGRGAEAFDNAFLQEIEEWRKALAVSIAASNPLIDEYALNFAVQRIIDRILFLRIAEDRGTEPPGQLQGLLSGDGVYKRLIKVFRDADDRYNSGLFHFHQERGRDEDPDSITQTIAVPDRALRDILECLYYPKSPYEFTVVSADILGSVYERFLGKIITLTPTHKARIEERPEIRKAGGVYYTPAYIVRHIVTNTLAGALAGKSAKNNRIKVVDPACGSGSFLIVAYQFLLDWYLNYYTGSGDPKLIAGGKQPILRQSPAGSWCLTIHERKRILLEHIHGVDLDAQAVEVTKLNLLLKCLEGETTQSLGFQQRLFQERALPDLGRNVKCGNSLIGTDVVHTQWWAHAGDDDKRRINPFDYESSFPSVFSGRTRGFDVVIGNPPYVVLQDDNRDDDRMGYLRARYPALSYKVDTYHIFMIRAVGLTKAGGSWGFITPANFLTNNGLAQLRKTLLRAGDLSITTITGPVFHGVSVDTAISIQTRLSGDSPGKLRLASASTDGESLRPIKEITVSGADIEQSEHALFTGTASHDEVALLHRIKNSCTPLGQIADVNFGKQLRDRKKFTSDVIMCANLTDVPSTHRPCLTGRDIARFSLTWGGLACLDDQAARRGGCWDPVKHQGRMKLVTRQIGEYPEFAVDEVGMDCLNTVFMVNITSSDYSPHYVLGCLNSIVTRRYWQAFFFDQRDTFPKIKGTYLKMLPVPPIGAGTENGDAEKLEALVAQMISARKKEEEEPVPQAKEQVRREIAALEREIDRVACRLYSLSDIEAAMLTPPQEE